MASKLVAIRFLTTRATPYGCHYGGIVYQVPPQFARQVVREERCAEYVKRDEDEET